MVSSLSRPNVSGCQDADSSLRPQGKISIIASDLSASGAGRWQGAVRPFLLSQALQTLGYDVEILGFAESTTSNFSTHVPIKVVQGANYPQFFKSVRQLMASLDGDIIYAYKLKPSSFGISLLHKLTQRRPVILDIDDWELSWHGGDDWKYQGSWRQRTRDVLKSDGALRNPDHPLYLRWIEKFVPRADAITLHTHFLQNRFGGHLVPNGKDTALFDPNLYDPQESRQKYGLSEYRVLMFPGAPRPYKGLEDILEALDALNQDDLRLVIVGGSPYDDYDTQLMQKWSRWIITLPKCSYRQMPEVVSAAHIIVVPQRDTPAAQAQFPLKLTDGMAMAKPILTTNVGDIPQILGNTGYLVSPSAPQQLASKISSIFQNLEAANHQGKAARERCIEHYSINSMKEALTNVLGLVTR